MRSNLIYITDTLVSFSHIFLVLVSVPMRALNRHLIKNNNNDRENERLASHGLLQSHPAR